MVYVAKWKVVVILVLCALGVIYALPNLLPRSTADALPAWLPHKQISLGLDLQGGSHLLMEVETQSVIRDRLNGLVDEVRSALVKQRVGYTGLGVVGNGVGFTLRNPSDADKARDAVRSLDPDTSLQVQGNRFALNLTEQALRDRTSAAVDQSIEIVRRRIDATGVREPTIQREGTDRILVELPGVGDPERIKQLIGKTAKLTFQMVDMDHSPEQAEGGNVPPGDMLLPLDKPAPDGKPQMFLVHRRVMVSGDTLVDAQPSFQDNQPVVSFRFDAVGARRFADATKANVGKPFAIVLDNKVISAPVIREPILGGAGIISGGFTVQEAQDLALLLRAGALPAPLKVLEERTVGPGMGAELDPRRRDRLHRRHGDRRGVHDRHLRAVRRDGLRRAHVQPVPDRGAALAPSGDADPARHCRHRAHRRHGGRRQRAYLRAHARGTTQRPNADLGDRHRFPARLRHHRRLQFDDVDRSGAFVQFRLGPGEGVRRDARDRHPHLDVHRDLGDPSPGHRLDAPRTPQGATAVTGR